jgi:hypothetical protein
MLPRLTLIASVFSGCASAPPTQCADELRAERVARDYAVQFLRLSKSQVAKMKADLGGFSIDDGREMTIQFYDPKIIHPNADGFIWAMDGGFPSYFSITVDVQKWQVVRHYASPE